MVIILDSLLGLSTGICVNLILNVSIIWGRERERYNTYIT